MKTFYIGMILILGISNFIFYKQSEHSYSRFEKERERCNHYYKLYYEYRFGQDTL